MDSDVKVSEFLQTYCDQLVDLNDIRRGVTLRDA